MRLDDHGAVACVHNAGRSKMAAAWFNVLADPAKAHVSAAVSAQ
jgi:protein-tyrosine-phosphatase